MPCERMRSVEYSICTVQGLFVRAYELYVSIRLLQLAKSITLK